MHVTCSLVFFTSVPHYLTYRSPVDVTVRNLQHFGVSCRSSCRTSSTYAFGTSTKQIIMRGAGPVHDRHRFRGDPTFHVGAVSEAYLACCRRLFPRSGILLWTLVFC